MLNEPTIEKLKTLRLEGMCAAWLEQQSATSNSALSFDERFAMLVDAEWTHRDNKRMTRTLKEAKLRFGQACVEGIDYPAKRELDKATVRQLASCRWVQEHQAILISGMTPAHSRIRHAERATVRSTAAHLASSTNSSSRERMAPTSECSHGSHASMS
jgi:hypothetical protein